MGAIVEAVALFPSEAHGSIPVLREVHVVQSWVFCVIFIRLNGQCIVCSSSNCFWLPLLITPSDYPFGIFNSFLWRLFGGIIAMRKTYRNSWGLFCVK